MPAWVAMTISSSASSPAASVALKSPLSSEANGSVVFHSGCCDARAFTRSSAKYTCTGTGCSHQSVPSLSKVAIRSGTGTKDGEPSLVTFSTKLKMLCLAGPSFQDGRGSAAKAASADDSGPGMTSVGESFFKAVSQGVLTSTPSTRERDPGDRSIGARVC